MKTCLVSGVALLLAACASTPSKDTGCLLESPFQYEQVVAFQNEGCVGNQWQLKFETDLNGDGVAEHFLATESYSRGASYSVFTKTVTGWQLISEEADIPSGHLEVEVLESGDEWRDFISYQPAGREGLLLKVTFRWNGERYEGVKVVEELP